MTKKTYDLLARAVTLHAQIMELEDDVNQEWRDSTDESDLAMLTPLEEALSNCESELSSFSLPDVIPPEPRDYNYSDHIKAAVDFLKDKYAVSDIITISVLESGGRGNNVTDCLIRLVTVTDDDGTDREFVLNTGVTKDYQIHVEEN